MRREKGEARKERGREGGGRKEEGRDGGREGGKEGGQEGEGKERRLGEYEGGEERNSS